MKRFKVLKDFAEYKQTLFVLTSDLEMERKILKSEGYQLL